MTALALAEAPAVEVIRGAEKAAVLLNRTRRRLMGMLAEPRSAAALSRKLGVPRQRLNYHLRELEREGLVECVEERKKGNCTERLLRATARSFLISPEALGNAGLTPAEAGDRYSAACLMTAASRAIREVAVLQARARREGKRLATLTLEGDVRFATAEARALFAEELSGAIAALVAKYHDENAAGGRSFRVLAAVHPVSDPNRPRSAGGIHE